MTPVSIIPMMNNVQPIIMALRAPSLSPSDPAIGEASAVTTLESAYAIVMAPWLQPNSVLSGSMNTPKRPCAPTIRPSA